MGRRVDFLAALVAGALALGGAGAASADTWFPHPSNATWTYTWSDTTYNTSGTVENVTVASENAANGCGWQLSWTGNTQIALQGGGPSIAQPDNGTICFQDQPNGLQNTDWSASAPPLNEPSLCVNPSTCADSLGAGLFNVIWGTRDPVIQEPLLQGTIWDATGGGSGNVTSVNQYLGLQVVKVPAFPDGVLAAAVRSQVAVAGVPGDSYGSGVRTTWWVDGVGPVRVVFDHLDGSITTVVLDATDLKPVPPPPDTDYFPLVQGSTAAYRWTNNRWMRKPEIDKATVVAAVPSAAKFVVKSVSGPIRAQGQYVFSRSLNGLVTTSGASSAATLLKFPPLGHRRHLFNPFDLMVYGFGPVLPAYAQTGSVWHTNAAYLQTFGVTGTTRIIGVRMVRVPAGRFRAVVVRSVLSQKGYRYGSGVRTMWFAPGRGLVKLTFAHRDGSTDTVVLIK
ncbi:MAG: hypothetical protein ACYCXW_07950 [Solirubrobacteraceae bacterium]